MTTEQLLDLRDEIGAGPLRSLTVYSTGRPRGADFIADVLNAQFTIEGGVQLRTSVLVSLIEESFDDFLAEDVTVLMFYLGRETVHGIEYLRDKLPMLGPGTWAAWEAYASQHAGRAMSRAEVLFGRPVTASDVEAALEHWQ